MKTNEKRVKSIMSKAKHYKSEKGAILTATAVSMCALIALVVHTSMDKNELPIVESGEESIIISNEVEEKGVMTFASKDELVEIFKENAKKYNGTRYFVTNDMAEVALAEAPKSAQSFNAVAKEQDNSSQVEGNYSTTNTQVQGVDEADIVKTNGKNIYYYNAMDNKIEIFDVQDKLSITKELEFDNNVRPFEMYLDDKYLVVLANTSMNVVYDEQKQVLKVASIKPYKYRETTKAIVYDLETYEIVKEVETEGYNVSSRKIGDDIYLVTNKYVSFYNTISEDEVLPMYRDTCVNDELKEVDISTVKYFPGFVDDSQCNYMIITSFSLDDLNEEANVNTYLGAGTEIYCSTENLYVTKANYNYVTGLAIMIDNGENPSKDTSYTAIHKFAIKDGDVKHVATGKVDGRLLNQFSMDEYDGYFRITTTNNEGNNLYVLDEELNQVGCLEKLAGGERIYSTRFMGDKAYVVTYKTVDPLFVIDLKNPSTPKVLGELKIPGYSSYLHPFGEHYLIGFGEDSVEKSYLNWEGKNEVVAYSTGLKLSIFDVEDYSNPKELYTMKIGGRGSYSELLYNHKALLLNEEEGIIAFPASLTSEAGNYDNGVPMYGDQIFNGALVYDISVEDGIALRGKIEHPYEGKFKDGIQRIIYIGDKLYTLSDSMIMSSDIKTIEKIDSVKF